MRLVSLLLILTASWATAADYLKEVKPLLAARCYSCHGALQQKAGLRLDTVAAMKESEVFVPGQSAKSPIIQHILGEAGFSKMPPPAEGEGLTPGQVQLIRAWIDAGAIAPPAEKPDPDPREHWSFRAPVKPRVSGVSHPIDELLTRQYQAKGLQPAGPAERSLLLRRVCLDLTGLPPTREQQERFLNDTSPTAYERLVDELLASHQYGERWGRHFLDIWRYSDWWGLGAELRNSQKHIWHWRDYVIENFNADTPYFQMLKEMLAADELYPTDAAKLRATGYLARPYFLFNRTTWLDEVIEHTAKGMLGLTFNCAKCHDHKYDPISMQDYYKLRAIFEPYQIRTDLVLGMIDVSSNGIPRAFDCNLDAKTYKHERGDDRRPVKDRPIEPGLPALLSFEPLVIKAVNLPLEAYRPQLQPHVEVSHRLNAENSVEKARRAFQESQARMGEPVALKAARVKASEAAVKVAEAELAAVPLRFAAERAKYQQPDQFKPRAQSAAKAEKQIALSKAEQSLANHDVAIQTAKPDQKAKLEQERSKLVKQIEAARKSLENPGESYTIPVGAVKSAESNVESAESRNRPFPSTSTGRRSALAHWIADARNPLTARVLVNHVWLRHFGQPLVPTIFDFGRKGTPPLNQDLLDWLAVEFTSRNTSLKHLHKLIVTSQAYQRSSSMKGLERNVPIDPENKYFWRQNSVRMDAQTVRDSLLSLSGTLDLTRGGEPVPISVQSASLRRSLYFFHSHNEHNKFLGQFDDANVLDCYRRTESIVPQQALALSNSAFALKQSSQIAQYLLKQYPRLDDTGFARVAFRYLLGSDPSPEELAACQEALTNWQHQLQAQKHPQPVEKSRTNLVGALLNHNDFITIR